MLTKTTMPKEGKNLIEFKDHHKSLKLPVVVNADFVMINQQASGYEPDPQNTKT
jgi:hypothetical protein